MSRKRVNDLAKSVPMYFTDTSGFHDTLWYCPSDDLIWIKSGATVYMQADLGTRCPLAHSLLRRNFILIGVL